MSQAIERAITTADGERLAGWYFPAASTSRHEPVLISGATGIRQDFYRAFAEWLAAQGHPVLTFDYRGIGASLKQEHIRQCRARKQDWGIFDMPAALETLLELTGAEKAALIGHSGGGQLFGLMENYRKISRVVGVSASSGYLGGMPFPFRVAAYALLRFYIPASCALLGYGAAQAIGWGEDLPSGVARQWSAWCSSPGYVANEFGRGVQRHHYEEFTAPVTVFHAGDDPIATRENVDDLLRLLPNASRQVVTLNPRDYGFTDIGHVKMFRRSYEALWPVIREPLIR